MEYEKNGENNKQHLRHPLGVKEVFFERDKTVNDLNPLISNSVQLSILQKTKKKKQK